MPAPRQLALVGLGGLANEIADPAARSAAAVVELGPGAVLLSRFGLDTAQVLLSGIESIAAQAPFRHLSTPGGRRIQVAMTNCGPWGWISDAHGYRYVSCDPQCDRPWPAIPAPFVALARRAAEAAGYPGFAPDACLVNRYAPGQGMGLHRDADERDRVAPIVSVSLGVDAIFLFGGLERTIKPRRMRVVHGDVAVWGAESRLAYHGVAPLARSHHPATGELRFNLTFRRTGALPPAHGRARARGGAT